MTMMSEKLDVAIADAVAAGALDERKHGVLIEGAKVCAATIDSAESPTAALLTAMLNYSKALGIVPTSTEIGRGCKPVQSEENKFEALRAQFRRSVSSQP